MVIQLIDGSFSLQNILLATGLFGLHQKRLELRSLLWRLNDDDQAHQRRPGKKDSAVDSPPPPEEQSVPFYMRPNPLHFSLALCLSIVVINLVNVLLCEVGEWHHWVLPRERAALSSSLAVQGMQSKTKRLPFSIAPAHSAAGARSKPIHHLGSFILLAL